MVPQLLKRRLASPSFAKKTASLLAKVADKILEHKKFGQDLLTTEECSTRETREYLMGLVFALRSDPEAAVKEINGQLLSAHLFVLGLDCDAPGHVAAMMFDVGRESAETALRHRL